MAPVGVLFIHGFLSEPQTWARFLSLAREDPQLGGLRCEAFRYSSPVKTVHPLRRTPGIDDIADRLLTFLAVDFAEHQHVALVTHSQGGLVAQRALARALAHDSAQLRRIRLLVMYACPNAGSDLGLTARRWAPFWRNPQERELRPLHAAVTDAQRIVLNQIARAPDHPIEIRAYAGDRDRVVPPQSAMHVFPDSGILPGDHFSIIQPDSLEHSSYRAFRRDVGTLLSVVDDHRPDPGQAGSPPVGRATPEPTTEEYELLLDRLLAVPGMGDRDFRERIYRLLPAPVREQIGRSPTPRPELIGLLTTLWEYRHLATWAALESALLLVAPHHPATAEIQPLLRDLAARTAPGRAGGTL